MKKQLLLSSAIATAMLLSACGDNASTSNTRTPLVKPQVSKPADTTAQTKPSDNQTKPETSSNATDTNSSGSSSSSSNGSSNAGGSPSSGTASGSSSGGHGHGHSHAGGSSSGGSSSGSSGSGSHSGAGSSGSSSGGTTSGGTGSGSTTTPPATTPPSTNPPATGTTPPTAGGSTTTPPASGGTGSGGTASGSGSTTTPPSTGTTPTTPPISTNPPTAGTTPPATPPSTTPPATGTTPPSTPKVPALMDMVIDVKNWKPTHEYDQNRQDINGFDIQINNKSYGDVERINLKDLGQGFQRLPYVETIKTTHQQTGEKKTYKNIGEMYLFQQGYSAIGEAIINQVVEVTDNGTKLISNGAPNHNFVVGEPVDRKLLPKTGTYHYLGTSHLAHIHNHHGFIERKQGDFKYSVDFGKRIGKGSITEQGGHVITLAETEFNPHDTYQLNGGSRSVGIFGSNNAESSLINDKKGSYSLMLFGKNAEEMVGELRIYGKDKQIRGIFGGKKQ